MSAYATRATQQDDPGQQAEDAQLYRAVLHELIHIGTDLARLTHQHAVAHAQAALQGAFPATPPQDHAAAFGHVARAIRRCIALARSLAHPPAQPRAAARPILHGTAAAPVRPAATPKGDGAQPPDAGLRDRPDAPDCDDDVTTRPVAEVIAEICRDLGLASPPGACSQQRRTPANLTELRPHLAAPSSARYSARQPGADPRGQARGTIGRHPTGAPPAPVPVGRAAPSRAQPPPAGGGAPAAADLIAIIPRHPGSPVPWRPPSDP